MEELERFLNEVEQDEELLKAVNDAKDLDEICAIAKNYGYYITIEDLENYYMQQVSGGNLVDKSSYTVTLNQNVSGEYNTALNLGNIGLNSILSDGNANQNINSLKEQSAEAAMNMVLDKLEQMLD